MPLTRLYAEGFGPFEKLDLDLSDGNGNPHLGPHILCGVNGCGKSTALRVLAWVLASEESGFPSTWLGSRIRKSSVGGRALAELRTESADPEVMAGFTSDEASGLVDWLKRNGPSSMIGELPGSYRERFMPNLGRRAWSAGFQTWAQGCVAAYSPSIVLSLSSRTGTADRPGPLSFESTIRPDQVVEWWKNVYLSRAVAKSENLSDHMAVRVTNLLDAAIQQITDGTVELGLDIDNLQPVPTTRYRRKKYTFDQLPSGMLCVLGVLTDYFRRLHDMRVARELDELPTGILLIDEVDASLHPSWQRRILPALRAALPDIQIICTTHSPFVINSCRDARIHVLEVAEDGTATAEPPMNAPFGKSFAATIKEIFDIPTDYDWETERQLKRWQDLKRKHAIATLSAAEQSELTGLVEELSSRGEELRALVAPVGSLNVDEIITMLESAKAKAI